MRPTVLLLALAALAVFAWLLHLLLGAALPWLGFPYVEALWGHVDRAWPVSSLFVRFIVFGSLHALIILALRRRLRPGLERAAALLAPLRRHPIFLALAWLAVAAVSVPFVVQPTLVPLRDVGLRGWTERAANLADGTASAVVAESVFGFYRAGVARPVLGPGVSAAAMAGFDGPLMRRWDPLIREVVDGDPRGFAVLKAFVFVESGGRQFAVSPTGCAGLMQFCAGTARDRAFRHIFGLGAVYPCGCGPDCRVAPDVKARLESGQVETVRRQADRFPCHLGDARFDAKRSLRAGWAYIQRLEAELGPRPDLVYIGYNSGPSVARALHRLLPAAATPRDLAAHLPAALRPAFGTASDARARSLVRDTLPRLRRAWRRALGER